MARPAAAVAPREPVYTAVATLLDAAVGALLRLHIEGAAHLPKDGPALLVANHVSHLDPVVLLAVAYRRGRRVRFLAVEEAFRRPVVGALLRAGRHIPVSPGAGLAALRGARAALAAGDLVLVARRDPIPPPGAAPAARGGAGLLAATAAVPVVPIGSYALDWSALPRRRTAAVVVGAPVAPPPSARGRDRYEAFGAELLARIRELSDRAEHLATGAPTRVRGGDAGKAAGGKPAERDDAMVTVTAGALRTALDQVDYPADKDELVRAAEQHDAPTDVQRALRSLPLATYDNVDEVIRSVTVDVGSAPTPAQRSEPDAGSDTPGVADRLR